MAQQEDLGKCKRSTPFSNDELLEMVRFLDLHNYEVAPPGEVKAHKTRVMQELAIHFNTKFGTQHSPRQFQKRFSDLKVREKSRLGGFRRKIAREAGILNARELAQLPRAKEDSSSLEGPSSLETTHQDMNTQEDATIILDLENVEPAENPQGLTCCHDANYWSQMELTIDRCIEKHLQNFRKDIIEDIKALLNPVTKDC